MFETVIALILICTIVGGIILYLYRSKKHGGKCVGCPHSMQCGSSCCSCNTSRKDK